MTIEENKALLARLRKKNPHMFNHPGAHTNEVCFGIMSCALANKMMEQLIEMGFQSARRAVDGRDHTRSRVYIDALEHAGVPTHK